MTSEIVKGFKDIEREEAEKRLEIQNIIVKEFEKYGFEPAETPIIEYEEFVKGENKQDEAVSDIFKLKDKGNRNLALRYEFTFQLKRLSQNKKLPYRRFQIGPVFRDEPISSNRFRQFIQCDADIIGSTLKSEAEIIAMASKILEKLGIKFKIFINSRKLLNSIINWAGIDKDKINDIIKELDKLDKISEDEVKENLKKINIEPLQITKIFLCLRKSSDINWFIEKEFYGTKDLKELLSYLKIYKIEPIFSASLARGLSYYNGTIFEIKTDEIKETICAGGSYLINNIQSTGVSLGLDRLSGLSSIKSNKKTILIVSINQDNETIALCEKLRKNDINCILIFGKPSKALEYANSYNLQYAVFVGQDEIKNKKFTLKDLKTGKEIKLGEDGLIKKLK